MLMKARLLALASVLLLAACVYVGQRKVAIKEPQVVQQAPSWAAVAADKETRDQIAENCQPPRCELLMIVAHNNVATTEAFRVLCKEPKSYVCTAPEKAAEVLYVERRRR